jgi:hypothetical protein
MSSWRLALLGISLPGAALQAQAMGPAVGDLKGTTYVGIGYVASVPTTFLGFSALVTTPQILGGAGLYADVKLTTGSPGDDPFFLSNVSVADAELTFGDQLFSDESDWVSVNLAMVYAITGEFALYGGAGYSKRDYYRQYYDDSLTRGDLGFYWVADPDNSGTRVNVLGGALLRVTRFALFQLGVESEPLGVDVGLMLTFSP